ncbi:hypothetical protein DESC_500159 [Desulfosarcina cetonica]|nr:hypothetical protein DESC_500159 [Desulfosarcina cetonica]
MQRERHETSQTGRFGNWTKPVGGILHLPAQEQPEKRQCPITQRPKHRTGKRAPHLAPDGSGDPLRRAGGQR